MSNKKMFFFLIILLLKTSILVDMEEFEIGARKTYKLKKSDTKYFKISNFQNKLLEGNFLVISSIPKSYQIPGYLYASFNPKITTSENRLFYSQNMGTNTIFINVEKLIDQSLLSFTVKTKDEAETEMTIEVKIISELTLSLYDKIHFRLSDVSQIRIPSKDIDAQKIFIYVTAENIFNFNLDLTYKISYKTKNFEMVQKYPNGKGAIISMSEIEDKQNGDFILKISADEEFIDKTINVGIEIADEGDNMKTETEILEHKYGATIEGENCYQMKSFNESKSATMLINTYSQYLTFTIKNAGERQYSLDVFNNNFIQFPSLFSSTNHYFCFKKFTPKEAETENLGEISYDFQIYYDKDYSYHRLEIFPLINGQIYIHSIPSGDIFVYRHHSFTNLINDKKIENVYSANLLAIRGKPHLEGDFGRSLLSNYNPESYKSSEKYLLGQHSLLKSNTAWGNIKKDANIDPVSELEYQYLTIVKCETDIMYPNIGECKYAIEINNDLDIIQLSPEIPFATITNYPINYFHIKVIDYQTIKYLKIFFTSLTGSVNILLYEDRNFQNLINTYNFRHVHKKQIIEITENFKEDYYIKLTSVENSFIEIKYETDFLYKGYTMLTPNEVNIEYVNKKDGFQPYEVQNPHYFYPINNKRNNDFYFTIKSLDCSMTYKYDFIDFNGIESIHHEVKKNDINFATSYGFMLEVDNYYHTIADDAEDSTIIISNGEKSKNIPLVLIENYPHPSNFSEIYYTFPFIFDSNFTGIFVDIKYDYESLSKTNKSHLIQLIISLGAKEVENRKFIANDYTFFLEKGQVEDIYNSNMLCYLNITIFKNKDEEENEFTLVTNVYRANSLSPEYIYKNNLYNYKLLASGAKYFYTQIDLNEEGEINCNFLEGNGIIAAKIVRKDEIEENFNWNNRVKLPESGDENLLKYDPFYHTIRYTKEDTKKCEKGCELYFKIKSEEITCNTTEFTEFSFYVNDKKNNTVTIRFNDYIKGNLEDREDRNYKIKIPVNCIKFAINLYSNYGKAKIKYGENFEWDIIPENEFERLIITNETINKQNLKGEEFLIIISTKDLPEGELKEHYLDYYLQVYPLYNNEKDYYHLTSERSIICNTGSDTFCHVLVYQNHYYNNETKIIYAQPMDEYKEINIYATNYSVGAFNELYPEYTQTMKGRFFPTKYNSEAKSEQKAYLLLGTTTWKSYVNYYVYLTVDCGVTNSSIKLILSGNYNSKTLLKYNHDKVIYWKNEITFLLPSNDTDYILYIKNINNFYMNINLTHRDYFYYNYYTEIQKGRPFDLSSYSTFGLIYINVRKKSIDNIYKIDKNDRNRFNITGEIFPQYVYTKLINPQTIQFSFYSFSSTKYEEKNSFDLFNIEAFIIDQKNFESKMISSQYQIQGEKINAYFMEFEEIGIVNIPFNKIPAGKNNYVLVKIDKKEENMNKYKQVITDYSVVERIEGDENSPITFYTFKTYFSKLDNSHNRECYSFSSSGNYYLIIDIAESIPFNDTFSFLLYGTSSYSIIDYYGRKRIKVNDFKEGKNVKFYISKKDNIEDQSKNYSFTFAIVKDANEYYKFQSKFNRSIIIHRANDTNKSILTIKNIYDQLRVKYTLNIYEKKDETNTISKINTTYTGTKHKNEVYSTVFERFDYEEYINIELNYTKEDLKKKYLVRIIADRTTYNEVVERYIYDSNLVDFEDEESDDKSDGKSDDGKDDEDGNHSDKDDKEEDDDSGSDGASLALIIPLTIVGIALILAGVFYFLRKRRASNISEETIEQEFKETPLRPISR